MKKNFLLISISLFLGFIYSGSIYAQNTELVCPYTTINNIPKGWVLVDIKKCTCCSNGNIQWTIKKIVDLPVGSVEYVCNVENLPIGWVIIDEKLCTCCHPTDNQTKQWVIKRID